jgi:putative sterol carrier protein
VATFLSNSWFERLNKALGDAGRVPQKTGAIMRIVFQFSDAPSGAPDALTFTISDHQASADPGDNLLADTLVSLSYADARALFRGKFDSATALREGRVKVRGDINALVPLLSWMQAAQAAVNPDSTPDDDTDDQ